MKTDNKTLLSLINFLFFTTNFQGGFDRNIEEAFKDSDISVNHLKDKWKGVLNRPIHADRGYAPAGAIIDFFFELSDGNKKIFFDWIEQNYHNSREHARAVLDSEEAVNAYFD